MGTAIQVLLVDGLASVAGVLSTFSSGPGSRLEFLTRALAILATVFFLGKLGVLARYGYYLPTSAVVQAEYQNVARPSSEENVRSVV